MSEKVKLTKNGAKVLTGEGYNKDVEVLAKIKDTGNGFICYFPTYSNTLQDNYICLDYDEAEYIRLALNALHERGE
jgi:hypothetical protein